MFLLDFWSFFTYFWFYFVDLWLGVIDFLMFFPLFFSWFFIASVVFDWFNVLSIHWLGGDAPQATQRKRGTDLEKERADKDQVV